MNEPGETTSEQTLPVSANKRPTFWPRGEAAARASWMVPVFTLLGSCVWSSTQRNRQEGIDGFYQIAAIVIALLMLFALLSGLILSIYALLSTRKQGRKGIMGRAILGLILNVLLLSALIIGFVLPLTIGFDEKWRVVEATAIAGQGYTADYQVEMKGKVLKESDHVTHPNGIEIFLYDKRATSSGGHVLMRVVEVSAHQPGGYVSTNDSLYEDVILNTLKQFDGTETSRENVGEGGLMLNVDGQTQKPKGRIRFEIHERGSSVYGVIYMAELGHWNQDDADRFFDSFEFLDKNKQVDSSD